MNAKTKTILSNPWVYFAATFAWTWGIWTAVILSGQTMETGTLLLLVGVFGPMVTGIAFTYLTRGKEGRRDYWQRIIDFKRIPFKWYLIVFLFAPILNIFAALIDVLLGGTGATWGEAALNIISDPSAVILSLMFASLIPFVEELGWRGYVLDRLQEKHSALVATLILGTVWMLWHLPLFFVEGSYQSGLGVGTLAFWLFFIGGIFLNIPFTWIYNNTNRSTLAVILFHCMINFTGEAIAISLRADTYATFLWFAAAIAITAIWGAKTMTGKVSGSQVLSHSLDSV